MAVAGSLCASAVWAVLCSREGPGAGAHAPLRPQQAANIVRALELFVKPDALSGENAYMCAR